MSVSNDENTRLTPSAAKLKRIMGPAPGCRNLTPYEIELLRKSKQEIDQLVGEVLKRKDSSKDQGC